MVHEGIFDRNSFYFLEQRYKQQQNHQIVDDQLYQVEKRKGINRDDKLNQYENILPSHHL